MEIAVIQSGPFSTIQDLGRCGWRGLGVPPGGAADALSLRLANLLVGNPENAAGIECTLGGPELEFSEATGIAIGGGSFKGVASWQVMRVAAGSRLALGWLDQGCRAYLAVAGGVAVEPVLGSRSTCLAAGFGGHKGRRLEKGDILVIAPPQVKRARPGPVGVVPTPSRPSIPAELRPIIGAETTLRFLPGDHAGEFQADWNAATFRVSPASDRMGVRLAGKRIVRANPRELPSAAAVPGTIQVPPDGNPIVLLADAQTLGGYPRIGHVIEVDLPAAAQMRPGDTVRFRKVDLEKAHSLLRQRERAMKSFREALGV